MYLDHFVVVQIVGVTQDIGIVMGVGRAVNRTTSRILLLRHRRDLLHLLHPHLEQRTGWCIRMLEVSDLSWEAALPSCPKSATPTLWDSLRNVFSSMTLMANSTSLLLIEVISLQTPHRIASGDWMWYRVLSWRSIHRLQPQRSIIWTTFEGLILALDDIMIFQQPPSFSMLTMAR